MVLLATEIEIAGPPEKFLDWAKYLEWKPSHIKIIEATPHKPVAELREGDKLQVVLEGLTFSPENTEKQFKWRGSLPYIFTGDHYFRFTPSETTPGSTLFQQGEDFSGALSVLMYFSWGTNTHTNFQKFNEDIKKRVESLE